MGVHTFGKEVSQGGGHEKGGSQGGFTKRGVHREDSRKGGFTGGFTKRGVHRGVHEKGGSREPCEPPLATGLELNCDELHIILITFIYIITPLLTSTYRPKPVLARDPSSIPKCYHIIMIYLSIRPNPVS